MKLAGSEKGEFRVALGCSKQLFQPIRLRERIRVEHGQPFPARQARPEIIGGGEASVFVQPLHAQDQPRPAAFHSIQGAIRGAVVNQHDFEILERLRRQAAQAASQGCGAVPCDQDDRDARVWVKIGHSL